ncbi:unnamed protein product [Tenebrio molitor]|nr:unnamed protein product [Tenebrio molitor]
MTNDNHYQCENTSRYIYFGKDNSEQSSTLIFSRV